MLVDTRLINKQLFTYPMIGHKVLNLYITKTIACNKKKKKKKKKKKFTKNINL